jgi:8-oxo-dGTP pyrophosphatase MutT (NUDIX family)
MYRRALLSLLENHAPLDAAEQDMCLKTIAFVQENPACFDRSLRAGHITASAWVVSPDRRQVLLMHHAKLDRWFQPGGHCDGDPDVLGVALKEAREETGAVVHPVSPAIYDVDVHTIPANAREPAHEHYDIRFLLEADPGGDMKRNAESKEIRWVSVEDIVNYNASESIMRMQRKCAVNT